MSTIITYTTKNGQILAKGTLGQQVQQLEGNYYFDRSTVNLDLMAIQPTAYFCPVKKSTCDYYFLKDEYGRATGYEKAWIYETINNSIFDSIAGKVGFYARSSEGLTMKEEEF